MLLEPARPTAYRPSRLYPFASVRRVSFRELRGDAAAVDRGFAHAAPSPWAVYRVISFLPAYTIAAAKLAECTRNATGDIPGTPEHVVCRRDCPNLDHVSILVAYTSIARPSGGEAELAKRHSASIPAYRSTQGQPQQDSAHRHVSATGLSDSLGCSGSSKGTL